MIAKSQSRSIYVYYYILYNINIKISTFVKHVRFHGLMVTTFAFWLEVHEFESHPGQAFFNFFYKNETKSEEICEHQRVCVLS